MTASSDSELDRSYNGLDEVESHDFEISDREVSEILQELPVSPDVAEGTMPPISLEEIDIV